MLKRKAHVGPGKFYDPDTRRVPDYSEDKRRVRQDIYHHDRAELDGAISQQSQEAFLQEDEARPEASHEFKWRALYLSQVRPEWNPDKEAERRCFRLERLLSLPKDDMGLLAVEHLQQLRRE